MQRLDNSTIRAALARVADLLRIEREVEILIVGGAAGTLTGELPPSWTTADVDVMQCRFPDDREAVMTAAETAARELDLPPSWISEDAGLFAWTLPNGWQTRRVEVGAFGNLRVFAVGRSDLIAMKFVAHRERDLEHLVQMRVKSAELDFVVAYLNDLVSDHPEELGRIDLTREYIRRWKVQT